MWYTLFMSLVFFAVVLIFGIFGGASPVVLPRRVGLTLALFLGIFFSLVFGRPRSALSLLFLPTVFGIASFFKAKGHGRPSGGSIFWERQSAFWLYALLSGIYHGSFILMMITYPFT
jgi:hypothetical protein